MFRTILVVLLSLLLVLMIAASVECSIVTGHRSPRDHTRHLGTLQWAANGLYMSPPSFDFVGEEREQDKKDADSSLSTNLDDVDDSSFEPIVEVQNVTTFAPSSTTTTTTASSVMDPKVEHHKAHDTLPNPSPSPPVNVSRLTEFCFVSIPVCLKTLN